jgi:hypothetical protein
MLRTVTSARTKSGVHDAVGVSLMLPRSLVAGDQHGKLDDDLRALASLGTPFVLSVYDYYYYPFALEDVGWLAPMAVEVVARLAILANIHRFPCIGAAEARSVSSDIYVCMEELVRRSIYFHSFPPFLG